MIYVIYRDDSNKILATYKSFKEVNIKLDEMKRALRTVPYSLRIGKIGRSDDE